MPLDPHVLELADRLIDIVKRELGFQVIVCEEAGVIVRATIHKRIGTTHAGARKIMQEGLDEYVVTPEEALRDPSMREGLACPFVVNHRRVGVFAVSGPISTARPLAHLCAMLLESWLREGPSARGPQAASAEAVPAGSRGAPELARALQDVEATVTAAAASLAQVAKTIEGASAALSRCAASIREDGRASPGQPLSGQTAGTRAGR